MKHVELSVDGQGHGSLVIDGQDLSSATRAVHIRTGIGRPTTVEVTLAGVAAIEVDGEVRLVMRDEAREALIAHGWTPPRPS